VSPTSPYLSWLLAALAVLLLMWLAWRRPNRKWLTGRLLASAVAGVSLVLLVFPPSLQRATAPTAAILLTEGYQPDTLEALLRKAEAKPAVYGYKIGTTEATLIADPYLLKQRHPGLQKLHVLGYGLEEDELEALRQVQVIPHLTELPAGISAVHWPESIRLGEALEVSGTYENKAEKAVWLYLQAAGRARDSVEVRSGSTCRFRLRYTPKQEGRFTYRLLAKKGERTDTLGVIPVQVKPVQPLGVLLLSRAPSFEFKFLKNHLAALQHRVALRSTVSKDLHQSEWLNRPRVDLSRLTPRLLEQFDIVLTEPQALQSLTAGERSALEQAVAQQGLGVLTLATVPPPGSSLAFFTPSEAKRLTPQTTRAVQAAWGEGSTALTQAAPYALAPAAALRKLVEEDGRVLVGAKRVGWGWVALSFVPQTFAWQLEGKPAVYAGYWAAVLSGIAKEAVLEQYWQLDGTRLPQADRPLVLTYTDLRHDQVAALPAATVTQLADSSTIQLALAQQVVQPEKFSGAFWPRHSGWHRVQSGNAAPYFFYVQDAGSWRFQGIKRKREATQAFVAQQAAKSVDKHVRYEQEPVPLVYFFILFVLSSGFLWLEEKL